MMAGEPTVRERIYVHLLTIRAVESLGEGGIPVAEAEQTQDGIAEACGLERAHATVELSRAIREGTVRVELCHVDGRPRRVYAYRLTFQGVRRAEGLMRSSRSQTAIEGKVG